MDETWARELATVLAEMFPRAAVTALPRKYFATTWMIQATPASANERNNITNIARVGSLGHIWDGTLLRLM